jgi:predicted O-linked N-acetylglucosamine transferase (SPINDLY family)
MPPTTIDHAFRMAVAQHQSGRMAEAEALYRQVLAENPAHADALHLLGVLASQRACPEVAVDLIGRAIALNPTAAGYHHNLGEVLRRSGKPERAVASFRRAIELRPLHAETHNNLGVSLYELGRIDEAIAAYQRALELNPASGWAQVNLGNALLAAGKFDEATAACATAVKLDPNFAEAHNSLGVALQHSGRSDQAITVYRRAIALRPDYAEAYSNLGNVLRERGGVDEAIAAYRTAVAVKPDSFREASNLLFTLHFHPESDARSIRAEHVKWANRFAEPLAGEIRPHSNDRNPDRKLRVGFVSPDFRAHAVGQLLYPLFRHHDRHQSAFIGYSDVRTADHATERFIAIADEWRGTPGMCDAELADRVRADGIDILVDLTLHAAANRLLVFARKPAPVQVTMLGMPTTTGLSTIDYRITDPYLDPPDRGDADYSERSIRLPRTTWVYEPPESAPAVTPLPALGRGFVTFGCLNQFAKATPLALQLWAMVLQALPGSRLVLQSVPGSHLEPVRGLFQQSGIAADRLDFLPRTARAEYLERYGQIDIGLDPFPYNGHTTTFDALWMGVPVVTLEGRTAVGRGGVSILSNIGLPELIACTPEEYVQIAVGWGSDLSRLATLRSELRARMQSSALLDGPQFAADVDAAFRAMWRTWCAG